MEPTEAEKRQARRVQLLLYFLVAIMIVVPAVIFIVRLP
jgi:predicted nucleic acid-binding Zn ribbon protein